MKDLSRHLKEAIEINSNRLPRYAKLTKGASIPFSKQLIRYEKLALWGAWFFDCIGDKYQKLGIPYMKSEFVEMSLTPTFSTAFPFHIDFAKPIKKIDIHSFSKDLKQQIKQKNFDRIVQFCNDILHQLEQQPHVYCMFRHMVESLRRIAHLIPIHQSNCDKLQIKSPTAYSVFLLKTHRWAFGESIKLDEAIAPIQLNGVPFLFQDLPHIDLELG